MLDVVDLASLLNQTHLAERCRISLVVHG